MKNHEWVNGKLLQTNKKYSQLKLKQKEKIYQWMYDAYRAKYQELGKYPDTKDIDDILASVMEQIEQAEIWIPYREVRKHFQGCMTRLRNRLKRERLGKQENPNRIKALGMGFSICKVENYSGIDIDQPFVFTGRTDEEKSLVCPTTLVPGNTTEQEDHWRAFRIQGQMDFSLIGILARISKLLASSGIGIFVISTYNTDYVLVKKKDFQRTLKVLAGSNYQIISDNVTADGPQEDASFDGSTSDYEPNC